MTCTFPDCGREEACKGLCWAHYRQQSRGKPLRPLEKYKHESPKAMTVEAMLAFAEATDDDAFERAWHRARMAWRRYFKRNQLKWRDSEHSSKAPAE